MIKIKNGDAVASLRPAVPFVMYDDDLSRVEWHVDNVATPTEKEVQAEKARLEKAAIDKEAADQAATVAAISHAKSLGFTEAMIAVMYPTLTP